MQVVLVPHTKRRQGRSPARQPQSLSRQPDPASQPSAPSTSRLAAEMPTPNARNARDRSRLTHSSAGRWERKPQRSSGIHGMHEEGMQPACVGVGGASPATARRRTSTKPTRSQQRLLRPMKNLTCGANATFGGKRNSVGYAMGSGGRTGVAFLIGSAAWSDRTGRPAAPLPIAGPKWAISDLVSLHRCGRGC